MSDRSMSNRHHENDQLEKQIHGLFREPPRRRWLRWSLGVVLALFTLVLLLPTLVSRTSLRDFLLSQAIQQEVGNLSIESLEIGWFTPLSVTGVTLVDPEGTPLLSIERISGERSLLELAQAPTNLGSIIITKPEVNLQLRADGSNLEDMLAQLGPLDDATAEAQPDAAADAMVLHGKIQLVDAEIVATDTVSRNSWSLHGVQVKAELPQAADSAWKLEMTGALDGQTFDVAFASPIGLASEQWPLGPQGSLTLRTDAIPLAPLQYAAVRSGQPVDELRGSLSSQLQAQWQPEPGETDVPRVVVGGQLRADGLVVAAKELFGNDVLNVQSATLVSQLEASKQKLSIEQVHFESDYGKLSLASTVSWENYQDLNELLVRLRQQQLTTQGEIDLAALCQSLPETLKIRDDIHIASGKVHWSVNATPQGNAATKWDGKLQTNDVEILRSGQPMDWQFPLDVEFVVTDGQEMVLQKLAATSFFFALSGQGKLHEGQIHAKADLERLMYQVGQIMDVNNVYLRGQLQTVLNWREVQGNQLAFENRARLVDFVMTQNEQLLCRESELDTSVKATATLTGQEVASLDTLRVDLIAADDFMVAELQQPVLNPSAESDWNLACRLKGKLGSWFDRMRTLGIARDWQVAGQIDATAQVAANLKNASFQDFHVHVRELQAATDGLHIHEPIVQIRTAGSIDLVTGNCQFPKTEFGSQSLSCTAHQFDVTVEPHFVVSGDVDYRADLARLLAVIPTDTNDSSIQINGETTGRLALQADGQTTSFRVDGTIKNLHVLDAAGVTLWQEPDATISTTGTYDAVADSLRLGGAQVVGKAMSLSAVGQATALTSRPHVEMNGEYGYDLAGLTAIFRDVLGPDIELKGTQRHAFAIHGPIQPAVPGQGWVAEELTAQVQAGWQSADAYGIRLGPGQVDAVVSEGLLEVLPVSVQVGDGFVRLAPTIHLNTEAMWMTLPSGPVIDRIRLDPQMTAGWMKYITPLMADATTAEGTFSVHLGKTEVPLMDPTQGHVEGQFVIHGGALGPGPMANQLLDLATQVKRLTGKGNSRIADPTKSWVSLGEQQIDFQMTKGRVYHRGFQMMVDGVPITTTGSVGIDDQSLDVIATVPILDEWLEGSPNLAGLRGQAISVPIRGTTSSPQLDQRALRQDTLQLARRGVAGYLQGQLNEKLGSKVQDALGGSLGSFLGGNQQNQPRNRGDSDQAESAQPPQDLGTQLQNRAEKEVTRQLQKLFK